MTSINTNTASTIAANALYKNERKMGVAMERLSTGLRINSAKDDAAGLAIAKKMSAQISGLRQASRNANDGIAMLQTFEGASGEITSMLNRMRDLKLQSLNGTYTAADRANLGEEYNSLRNEIARTVNDTQWNTRNLMKGGTTVSLMIGANAGQTMDVSIQDWSLNVYTTSANLIGGGVTQIAETVADNGDTGGAGLSKADVKYDLGNITLGVNESLTITIGADVHTFQNRSSSSLSGSGLATYIATNYTATNWDLSVATTDNVRFLAKAIGSIAGARTATTTTTTGGVTVDAWSTADNLRQIDSAITAATSERSKYGAYISRLEKTSDNLLNVAMNTDASRGQIEDADYASETTELARTQIIAQAGTAMLAQANQIKQTVLALLQ